MAGRSLNKVQIIGNLGKDPEVRHFEGDMSVARLAVATDESYKDKNGQMVERTEWHNVVLWRGLSKVAEQYLKKGDKVYIEGRIRTRSWEAENKEMKYITEVEGQQMIMLTPKGTSGNAAPMPSPDGAPAAQPASNDSDLPKSGETSGSQSDDAGEDDLPF